MLRKIQQNLLTPLVKNNPLSPKLYHYICTLISILANLFTIQLHKHSLLLRIKDENVTPVSITTTVSESKFK